jgi:hypothetical protein
VLDADIFAARKYLLIEGLKWRTLICGVENRTTDRYTHRNELIDSNVRAQHCLADAQVGALPTEGTV